MGVGWLGKLGRFEVENLWGDVAWGATFRVKEDLVGGVLCESEINNDWMDVCLLFENHDVLQFEVPVHDVVLVHFLQTDQ